MDNKYIKIDVGRAENLIGYIFGDFKVLYRVQSDTKQPKWLCECSLCHKQIIKDTPTLKHNQNQCDCRNSLVGKTFGRWTVEYLCDYKAKNRGYIYHCKCECGNEKDVPAETLRSGQSKSCGCYQKEIFSNNRKINPPIDLTGQRFGKLVALYPLKNTDKKKHSIWHCQCDCGNTVDVDLSNLRRGLSKSCGCQSSRQEEEIIKLLTANNIDFKYQYKFNDLPNLKFDFFIQDKYIIEYDGQQHFYYTETGWDTQDHFNRTHKNDLIKNQYCFINNIPIIRIPYNQQYNFNDLILATSRFILTPDKELEYYQA